MNAVGSAMALRPLLRMLVCLLAWLALPAWAQDTWRDDFTTTEWDENTGTRPFAAAWSRDGEAVRVSGEEARLWEDESYIARTANLSGHDVATLTLRVRSLGRLEPSDRLRVQIAPDADGPWTTLETFSDDVPVAVDRSYSLDRALVTAATTIRLFVENTEGGGERWAVDFVELRAIAPTCFFDDFNATPLNPADWATSSVSGSFGQPRIIGNRLRLTDNTGNVSTAASLLRLFPGADNRVVVEFDYLAYAGSGADGIAITLSDAEITPVPGGFGGSLGYAQRTGIAGFAGGWLGVGLDAFGNFSNPTEGRVGGPGFRPDAVALRGSGSGTSGYPFLRGTATLSPGIDITGTTPGPNHRYRITVDNRVGSGGTLVGVERNTGSGFVTLVAPFDIFAVNPAQATVPDHFRLSLTGSTGGSTNIHEIDNLRVCATRVNPIIEVDHYRFFHDGQGLTCGPESIRIVACRDANCTQEVAGPLRVTLSPSGWVGGDTPTITSGQTLQFRRTTPGNATLAITSSNPPRRPFTPDRCFIGGVQQANCVLQFADSGFVFDVANHDADTPQSVLLSAVRRDEVTQACVPGFANVTRSIAFGSRYQNPTTGSLAVRVNGTVVATGGSPATALPLDFDANGRSTLSVQYADAGSMRLFARYTGSTATEDAGLVMDGQDDFVARPILHLEVTSPTNPAATDATGGVFTVAGQDFASRVTARNVNGVATPNFGRESPVEAVQLRSSLVAPAGGNNPAPVGSLGAAVNGVLSGNWRWDEVGIIGLAAHLVDNDYLGAGDLSRPAAAVLPRVGRFVPQRLAVSANAPAFAASCAAGGFGYVGQEFGFALAPQFTVTAQTAQGGVAGNYVNLGTAPGARFWRLAGSLPGRSYANTAATAAVLSRSTVGSAYAPTGVDAPPFDGSGVLQASDPLLLDRLSYARPSAPEAPFLPRVTLTVPAADLTDADGRCHDPDGNGSCDAFVVPGITGPEQRWGRIAMDNAFGPDLIDLQVPMRAEFFNGSSFVLNTDDACTLPSPLTLSDPAPADALLPGETCVQDSGAPGASGIGCTVPGPLARRYAATPTAGRWNLWLRAPGAGNVGMLDLTPTVPPWLQFNWRGAGIEPPRARVGFGVFQGDRRAIHTREVY